MYMYYKRPIDSLSRTCFISTKNMPLFHKALLVVACLPLCFGADSLATTTQASTGDPLAACPGYKASNVKHTATGVNADLTLKGPACNVYGTDLNNLVLEVTYDTGRFYTFVSLPTVDVAVRYAPDES